MGRGNEFYLPLSSLLSLLCSEVVTVDVAVVPLVAVVVTLLVAVVVTLTLLTLVSVSVSVTTPVGIGASEVVRILVNVVPSSPLVTVNVVGSSGV